MKKSMIILTAIMAMATAQPALAAGDTHHMGGHMQGDHHNGDMQKHGKHGDMDKMQGMKGDMSQMKGAFLVKKEIDGYTVSFHVMKAKEGMQHGGTHNFMAKVEKDDKALTNLVVNSKVTHPNNKSESKMLMKMGDWYMAGYDLGHEGQHQLMVLFKTADGKKHFIGTNYPENKHQYHDEEDAKESE
ncbi:hypothetical protein MMIC_P1588 [Mariprofundus micogutta]|uniref:YtkA-like domain-containing protein n=1 Tax=Mariprofundus micogutta TaxID=1921010 RepID=A0A1L8CNX1_9PROT|nr:hypothetical protein [Mariprofundus micogutta]GAV20616.1 hypothetical protein MMIC_P1588 [Mariprofundus micogutta]